MIKYIDQDILARIRRRLRFLYGDKADQLTERLYYLIGRYGVGVSPPLPPQERWNERDVYLITYADMVQCGGEAPLKTLHRFCSENLKGAINTVHLLPFYPWSSDDGFSVIDYREVKTDYGEWKHVESLSDDFRLMFDFVLNHCSSESSWFKDFLLGVQPGRDYFLPMDPKIDLSQVVRPRTSPLLTKTTTRDGEAWVWTTFSADQVDLNWQDPDLFFEFVDILFLYLAKGARTLRLDAIAFAWKELGTNCIHLPQTHEIVKLFRDICELVKPETIILTETNVPHKENVSYFGDGDEAHMVYNFSLPPLLLHGLLFGTSEHLTEWAINLEYPGEGCTYLNFTASHDGVGVRPLAGLVPDGELEKLVEKVEEKGGHVSKRRLPDGSESPYELNITYFSALNGTKDNPETAAARFLCSQGVALALKGVPAIYFHSLMATPNFHEGVAQTGRYRTINRRKYDEQTLQEIVSDGTTQGDIFRRYTQLLRRRSNYPAFHPDGAQQVFDVGPCLFALERTSVRGSQSVFCAFNFTDREQTLEKPADSKVFAASSKYYDIVGGRNLGDGSPRIKLRPYQFLWLTGRD